MPIADKAESLLSGTYADLASEYYDPKRHPTCANFGEASRLLMVPWLRDLAKDGVYVLETGAGASIVSEWLAEESRAIASFVVTDASQEMLRYSSGSGIYSEMVVCDAQRLPLASSSFDLVFASLGDPYNTLPFWREAARVLRPAGHLLFTSPSFEWALQFRNGCNTAEFVVSNGRAIAVPSYVESDDAQQRMIEACGLTLVEIRAVKDTELRSTRTPRSPKLRPGPIVSGYLARKGPR